MRVEVAYAWPGGTVVKRLQVTAGCTLVEAIRAAGLLEERAEIDLARNQVGIYGQPASLDTRLRDGDRVEIYRPLVADPKQARRRRARSGGRRS